MVIIKQTENSKKLQKINEIRKCIQETKNLLQEDLATAYERFTCEDQFELTCECGTTLKYSIYDCYNHYNEEAMFVKCPICGRAIRDGLVDMGVRSAKVTFVLNCYRTKGFAKCEHAKLFVLFEEFVVKFYPKIKEYRDEIKEFESLIEKVQNDEPVGNTDKLEEE